MPKYLKAYLLKELRQYSGWVEKVPAVESAAEQKQGPELKDDEIVYIHEDLKVTQGCFEDSPVIFDEVTPGWEQFCKDNLRFEVPDWEEESRQVREKLKAQEQDSSQ